MRKDQWCSKFEDGLFGTFKIPFQVDAYQKLIVKNLYLAWIHLNTCVISKLLNFSTRNMYHQNRNQISLAFQHVQSGG